MKTLWMFLFVVGRIQLASPTDLLIAIRQGDHTQVQQLLSSRADPNTADADGTTALMHAVIESDAQMVKLLIDSGADVNAKNSFDSTALMYAATNLEKTRLLLSAGADVKARNKRGATPMSVAVTAFESVEVLKALMENGGTPQDSMMTAAAQRGDLKTMEFLLASGVSPGGADSAPIYNALGAKCEPCARLLLDKGATVKGVTGRGEGVLSQTAKRAMPEMSQVLLDHGASLQVKDREGFTLLMQAVLSMEPLAQRDRMVEWLLAKGIDVNATNDRGQTAYQLASRMGFSSTLGLLKKFGAVETKDAEWPKPSSARTTRAAVEKVLPLIENSGEAVFRNRGCISCHNNSLPAVAVGMAGKKGFLINRAQAEKELGFAVTTEKPYLDQMRLGSSIAGGSVTVGYTLMGMAAAGYPADALTDSHIHYLSVAQYPDGAWRHTTSYRPPAEYSPIATTAVALQGIKLYPLPGRRAEFQNRLNRAKQWLLSAKAYSGEEQSMQLVGLAAAGANGSERAPFVRALKASQKEDGGWSQFPDLPSDAYATGQALYALHLAENLGMQDAVFERGINWLLRNQLSDGSWFAPARTVPIQPYFESGFPHGNNQWISDAASSWAVMALLSTLPDRVP